MWDFTHIKMIFILKRSNNKRTVFSNVYTTYKYSNKLPGDNTVTASGINVLGLNI